MLINIRAYAKVNLYLDITGRLPDGYHSLNTVMQSVSLYDSLSVTAKEESGIRLHCDAPGVPLDDRNTAFIAAQAFYRQTGYAPAADITIKKNIPSQAGLGGGSADAAGVLYALNLLYGEPLSRDILLEMCVGIGADVPFCLLGGTRECLNKGEIMRKLPDFSSFILLAKPRSGISTKEAFMKFDSGVEVVRPDCARLSAAFERGEGGNVLRYCGNVFDQLGEIENGESIKRVMAQNGALYAGLSGSGSTYFGCFENDGDMTRCRLALQNALPDLFLRETKTVDCGLRILE